jgi:amino-acid N-acetyltransferase
LQAGGGSGEAPQCMSMMTSTPHIPRTERARQSDLNGIHWLLDLESMPSADITVDALDSFLVYRDEIGVAGTVGLELYGDAALLRSLVVTSQHAGRGIGRQLVTAAEALARKRGVHAIYLLTTTAETFFEYMGFRRIGREQAPPAIERCTQFSSLCPTTAVLMVKP